MGRVRSRNFREYRVWQLADDLAVAIYTAVEPFPREEVYGLTSQLKRAVVSLAANIAEGAGRGSDADFCRFCEMARGSLSEVRYLIHLAGRLGILPVEVSRSLEVQADEVGAALHGLIAKLTADR